MDILKSNKILFTVTGLSLFLVLLLALSTSDKRVETVTNNEGSKQDLTENIVEPSQVQVDQESAENTTLEAISQTYWSDLTDSQKISLNPNQCDLEFETVSLVNGSCSPNSTGLISRSQQPSTVVAQTSQVYASSTTKKSTESQVANNQSQSFIQVESDSHQTDQTETGSSQSIQGSNNQEVYNPTSKNQEVVSQTETTSGQNSNYNTNQGSQSQTAQASQTTSNNQQQSSQGSNQNNNQQQSSQESNQNNNQQQQNTNQSTNWSYEASLFDCQLFTTGNVDEFYGGLASSNYSSDNLTKADLVANYQFCVIQIDYTNRGPNNYTFSDGCMKNLAKQNSVLVDNSDNSYSRTFYHPYACLQALMTLEVQQSFAEQVGFLINRNVTSFKEITIEGNSVTLPTRTVR